MIRWWDGMNINKTELEKEGFMGFVRIGELKINLRMIPKEMGVYLILTESDIHEFLVESMGGHFKNKNPTVPISELESNWVEDTPILYIGKAGGTNVKATLFSRLRQYMRYGMGKKIGHQGGRYIWQLKDSDDFIVAWKILDSEEPDDVETQMINEFKEKYSKRPFANLQK